MVMRGRTVQVLSGRCTANVPANVFIGADFNKAGAGVRAIGVAERAYNAGELVDYVTVGTAIIKLAAVLAAGATVAPDANGEAVASAANPVSGLLIEGGGVGDLVEMEVK